MVVDISPSLKALDDAVMERPKVRFNLYATHPVSTFLQTYHLSRPYGHAEVIGRCWYVWDHMGERGVKEI